MAEWRIFGQIPSRASDRDLVSWVRCYPSWDKLMHMPVDRQYSCYNIWSDVLDEIEFRGLLPLRGWREWSSTAHLIT